MSEWLSYSLSDLLLFSPDIWYRLIARYNAAIWPAQAVAMLLGLALAVAARRPGSASDRFIALALAACWIWIALAFHIDRYATINWAAAWFGIAFAIQALLLIVAVLGGWLRTGRKAKGAGTLLILFALFIQPLIGPLAGRDWSAIEIFGVMPDPTVVATLGILSSASGRTRWAMAAPDAWVMPIAGVTALGASLWKPRAMRG